MLTASAFAQPGTLLYDNGPFITGDGTEVCIEAPAGTTTSSPASGTTGGQQSYWVQARAIDDFTVPAGEAWTLDVLRWRAYQLGTEYDAEISTAYVRVWATNPQNGGQPLWGDFETNRYLNSVFAGVYRTGSTNLTDCLRAIKDVDIDLSGLPPLPPGQYWVEVGLDSELPGGLYSPPTEPRLASDNGLKADFSGAVVPVLDAGSNEPLEFPFELYGETGAVPTAACILADSTCIDATLADCVAIHNGTWNYFHACGELGACCVHADGTCEENIAPEDCAGLGHVFNVGQTCASIPNCGQSIGACCYPDDSPVHCQSLSRGADCAAQGGYWHPGSCSSTSCDDDCTTARVVGDGQTFFSTFGYDTDGPSTPNGCGNSPFVGDSDIWFRYTSTLENFGGQIEFSLCGATTYDTTMQVFQVGPGTSCDDLMGTAMAAYCDNDGCGVAGWASYLSVPANPGDEFLIRVGGFDGAEGSGALRIRLIEFGLGACCSIDGTCRLAHDFDCAFGTESFTPGVPCDAPEFDCPQVGACCRGILGCAIELQDLCEVSGGTFLGGGTTCGSGGDCDGDGETDVCAIAAGAPDCNGNGVPDLCDISLGEAATDCDGNLVPDSCQAPAYCCPGDVNGDASKDGRDIQQFLEAMFDVPPVCFSRPFCRLDVNGDFSFDDGDIVAFVDALLSEEACPILIHVSAQVNLVDEEGQVTGVGNRVFVFDGTGYLQYSYEQVPGAFTDIWGYRDGASDGEHVYFGWSGGVARHDADGSNGVQIIAGPVPSTGATWRALAFDPTGDGGNGSLWTQSFTSDLVETDLFGNLLNEYANDLNLYGLAYDQDTGMLWGHHLEGENADAVLVEIDPADGQPTGVSFPSAFGVSGGSLSGLAQYGGASFDPVTGTIYGLLQGQPDDAIFQCDTAGNLLTPFPTNPRADLNAQTGTIRNLGIAITRP